MDLFDREPQLYSSDSSDDNEEDALISPVSLGRPCRFHSPQLHHGRRDELFPPSPTSTCDGSVRSVRSARSARPSAADRKKRRRKRREIEEMLYGRGNSIDVPKSKSRSKNNQTDGEREEEEEALQRDDQFFYTLSVVLLFVFVGTVMGIKHGAISSSPSSKAVAAPIKVEHSEKDSKLFSDTGEYDKFLRVAPKDAPKIKPRTPSSFTASSSSTASTSSTSSVGEHGTGTNNTGEKPPIAAKPNVAAEDFIREHHHIEHEHHSDKVLSTFESYIQEEENEDGGSGSESRSSVHYQKDVDVPVFWHIPRSGGSTLQDIWGNCLGLTIANNIGVTGEHGSDESIQTFQYGEGATYVNVDTTTKDGILRAKELGLVQSNLADVVVTPYLYESAFLFDVADADKKGRCFTIMRDPIDRALSVFFYLQSSSEDLKFHLMTIEEYADSPYCEENWMVRFLTNKMSETITNDDLELAMEILERKCLVGFLDNLSESAKRFEKYFGWSNPSKDGGEKCGRDKILKEGDNVHSHPHYERYSHVWSLLKEKNAYDIKLYEYAKKLFVHQAHLFKD